MLYGYSRAWWLWIEAFTVAVREEREMLFQAVAFSNLPRESSSCIAMREESGLSSHREGGLDASGLFHTVFQLVSQRHLCESNRISGILNADNLRYPLFSHLTPDLIRDWCVMELKRERYNDDTSLEKGLLRATRLTAVVAVCIEHCFYCNYCCWKLTRR